MNPRAQSSDLTGCRRGRTRLDERLAAKEADRARLHREATARLQRKHG